MSAAVAGTTSGTPFRPAASSTTLRDVTQGHDDDGYLHSTARVGQHADRGRSLERLRFVEQLIPSLNLSFETTQERQRRAEAMRRLAALSMDPDSLDRESDFDLWGFVHDE